MFEVSSPGHTPYFDLIFTFHIALGYQCEFLDIEMIELNFNTCGSMYVFNRRMYAIF